jgi:hypothetical protein
MTSGRFRTAAGMRLDFPGFGRMMTEMTFPTEPVTLSVDQIRELNQRLADMRHDVNNHLTLIVSTIELIRCRPEGAERFLNMMANQPGKISDAISQYSGAMESALKIRRE